MRGKGGEEFIRLSKSFICDQVILIVTQPNSFHLPETNWFLIQDKNYKHLVSSKIKSAFQRGMLHTLSRAMRIKTNLKLALILKFKSKANCFSLSTKAHKTSRLAS